MMLSHITVPHLLVKYMIHETLWPCANPTDIQNQVKVHGMSSEVTLEAHCFKCWTSVFSKKSLGLSSLLKNDHGDRSSHTINQEFYHTLMLRKKIEEQRENSMQNLQLKSHNKNATLEIEGNSTLQN